MSVLLLGACDDPAGPVVPEPSNVRQYVTGAAAANLDSQGLFVLPPPAAPDDSPIVTAERAIDLALADVRSFGPSLRPYWQEERGGKINLGNLRADTRVFYAETPYDRFPEGYHPDFRKMYGPYYLVRLVSDSGPVLLIAVSGYATDVSIDENGYLDLPPVGGNEFASLGIPIDTARFQLLSPEQAAVRVARLAGARVTAVPELRLLGRPSVP